MLLKNANKNGLILMIIIVFLIILFNIFQNKSEIALVKSKADSTNINLVKLRDINNHEHRILSTKLDTVIANQEGAK